MPAQPQPTEFVLDGTKLDPDDLTFREQRELRTEVRKLLDDPSAQIDEVALIDYLPVLIWIVVKRDRPEYTLEEALDIKLADLLPPDGEADGDKPRPTKAARKR